MRKLLACLDKDVRLLLRGAGALALVLPLALALALRFVPLEAEDAGFVRPFPIAVRDEDGTVMSRSLISQMGRVELFSQILRPEEGESDAQLLARGAAAVVTIPKDFFYDIYSMSQSPVSVTLNGDMPLESALFRAVFCSVMDIIRAGQASWQGLYDFCYGELTPELRRALYDESSNDLLRDALSRQTVFDGAAEGADLRGALERRLLGPLLACAALFFCLCAVRTLPEERALGVLPRYHAAGGTLWAFVLSKLLTALLAILPTALLCGYLLPSGSGGGLVLLVLLLLFGAFGPLLAAAVWSDSPAAAQRAGNLFLLLCLVLGGGIWPVSLLPAPLEALGRLTPAYYALLGAEALGRGASIGGLLRLLWPLALMGGAGFAAAWPGLKPRKAHSHAKAPANPPQETASQGTGGHLSLPLRVAGMARIKLTAMSGGLPGLAALLAAALLCGGVAAQASKGGADCLRLAVCDLDGSGCSQELVELLEAQPGLSLTVCTQERSEQLLLRGEVEGVLTIPDRYGDALAVDEKPGLGYTSASSSSSAQGAREIIAGQVAVQRGRLRAVRLAGERVGPLNEGQTAALLDCIRRAEKNASQLYTITTGKGMPAADPFLPSPMAFAALAVLFTLLTAAPWSGSAGRRAAERLRTLPHGRLLAWGSECLALTVLGFLTALAALLPSGGDGLHALPAAAACAFCAAGLGMVLTRATAAEGRVDALAPLAALGLCLLGGCFMDLSGLSPALRTLSLLTPPGLAVRAAAGSLPALAALLAEGAVFLRLAVPGRK